MEHPKKVLQLTQEQMEMEKTFSIYSGSTTVHFYVLGYISILFCKTLWKVTSISKYHKQNYTLELCGSISNFIYLFALFFVCPRICWALLEVSFFPCSSIYTILGKELDGIVEVLIQYYMKIFCMNLLAKTAAKVKTLPTVPAADVSNNNTFYCSGTTLLCNSIPFWNDNLSLFPNLSFGRTPGISKSMWQSGCLWNCFLHVYQRFSYNSSWRCWFDPLCGRICELFGPTLASQLWEVMRK